MKTGLLTLLIVTTLSLTFSSCYKTDYFPCVKARGVAVEEFRVNENFEAIDLRVHAKVFVRIGPETEVIVKAPLNVMEFVQTRTSGNTLTIDNTRCITNRADDITVYITVPELKRIRLSGSGHIIVEDNLVAREMSVDIAGSGKVIFDGDFERLFCSVSGSGDIMAGGTVERQFLQISGSGSINTLNMQSTSADVKISGSGSSRVLVQDDLSVRIAGSGNVYYLGNPAIGMNINGTGQLIRL